MTKELIERITTKLFFIEQEAALICQDAALIRKWLENGTDKDPAFLAEINATNATHDPGDDYEVVYVATPAEIPDLEDVKPLVEEVKERFDLEATDVKTLIPLDRWKGLCNYVITGHKNGMEVSAQWVTETLISQGLATTTDQEKHLEQLRKTRRSMLAKDMDLRAAKDLNGIEVWEHAALETLAKENNLK